MEDKFIMLPWSFIRDKETTMMEKLILSEIINLSMLDKGCIASNRHFAEISGSSVNSISNHISSLATKGYITTDIELGSRNHGRTITVIKMILNPTQKVDTPYTKCVETKENKLINNNIGQVERIVKYLNTRTGKNFKVNSKANQRVILARIKEEYILEDFAKVIDIKVREWVGTDMEKFLRPETLFGNKFDSYLQQVAILNTTEGDSYGY